MASELSREVLIRNIIALKSSETKNLVDEKIKGFLELMRASDELLFKELCFCILTANYSAEGGIYIQEKIGDGFIYLDQENLERKLRIFGYRFPRKRAEYIVLARRYMSFLKKIIYSFNDSKLARDWLTDNIKGIGYKEASHFLRNIGFLDLAIIDYHVLNLLSKYQVIKRPKAMTRRRYLLIENILRDIAVETELKLGELDLYLWYIETGKVLK